MNLLKNEYMPLVNTRAGRIEACGLHFSTVAMTLDQRPMNIQGSFTTIYAKNSLPGLVIKITAVGARNGSPLRLKIHSASFRVAQQDTRAMKASSGEDGNSLMLFTHYGETGDFAFTFPDELYQGAWVSFSLDPRRGDYTSRLPKFEAADADTMKQIADCNGSALGTLLEEHKAQP